MKSSIICGLLLLAPNTYGQEVGANMRLLAPAAVFNGCVNQELPKAMSALGNIAFRTNTDAGNYVSRRVLEACIDRLTADEAQGRIMLNYNGNADQTSAFVEGILYSTRAYIFAATSKEWEKTGSYR